MSGDICGAHRGRGCCWYLAGEVKGAVTHYDAQDKLLWEKKKSVVLGLNHLNKPS